MQRVKNKVALVTGGSRGIAAKTAQILVEEGAHVIVTDILVAEGKALAESIGARFCELDFASEIAWQNTIDYIKD